MARAIRNRGKFGFSKDFRTEIRTQWLEQSQFSRRRQALCLQRRGFKKAGRALVKTEEQIPVRPFEVNGKRHGSANPDVLELRAPQIEEEALGPGRGFVRQFEPLHSAILDGWEVIGRCPVTRSVLFTQIDYSRFQCLQGGGAVTEVIEADFVEIIAAAIDRQVSCPIVSTAPVGHIFAGLERFYLVGAGPKRRVEGCLREILFGVVSLGEDRKFSQRERQVAGVIATEAVADVMRVQHIAGLDILDGDLDALITFGRQQPETVANIDCGECSAIGELRLAAQNKGHASAVGGDLGGAGDEAIHGIRLIGGAGHQAVEHQLEALHGVALQDVAVEAVERVTRNRTDEGNLASLRGIRIHIVKMSEAVRIFEIAKCR